MFRSRLFLVLFAAAVSSAIVVSFAQETKKPVGQKPVGKAVGKEEAKQKQASEVDEDEDDVYKVPEGNPAELIKFIETLQGLAEKRQFKTEKEVVTHVKRVANAMEIVAEKILASKSTDEEAERAADFLIHAKIARVQIRSLSIEDLLKQVADLRNDKRKIVASTAKKAYGELRISAYTRLKPAEQEEVRAEALHNLSESGDQAAIQVAITLAQTIERENTEIAGEYYNSLVEILKKSNSPISRKVLPMVTGTARRLQLPGKVMEVTGKTFEGKPFDVADWKGKVVLVDFWATWCGPCIAELPNVKKNYKKYHEKGFEVVGISLDKEQEKLAEFLEARAINWTILFETDAAKRGWETPAARYYGISGIPTAILLDQAGKVVSLNARGPKLGELLEELLGDKK